MKAGADVCDGYDMIQYIHKLRAAEAMGSLDDIANVGKWGKSGREWAGL